jgi:hypothetical protein
VRHTRFQVLATGLGPTTPSLSSLSRCAEALPFVSGARGGEHENAWRSGAAGEAMQRPRPYFVPTADGCCCRDLGGLTGLVCQGCVN